MRQKRRGKGDLRFWASARALDLLDRVTGILLTAIAVTLLVRGGTGLVESVLHSVR